MIAPLTAFTSRKRRQKRVILAIIAVLVLLILGLSRQKYTDIADDQARSVWGSKEAARHATRYDAGNATLGFERLLALSTGPSWRTRGLLAAANFSGLEFTIPPQPTNPDELVQAFQKMGIDRDKKPQAGSARAWLAHLDLLRFVIASRFQTALIVEDDVDWDVRIKTQMPLFSDNIRSYLDVSDDEHAPYGTTWDVLWLGHCGSAILDKMPRRPLAYVDDTAFPSDLYLGWSQPTLQKHLAEGHRQVQASIVTVCSFAYGVTKTGAQKVLSLIGKGADEAFDVALNMLCREGKLRCIVVNPQLFNHYEPPFNRGYVSSVRSGNGKGSAGDDAEYEGHKGTTRNILKSSRCEVLFQDQCAQPPSCFGRSRCSELYS